MWPKPSGSLRPSALGQQNISDIKARIATEGPLSTHAFDTKIEGKREMWSRPPHKKALDKMWYAGELATSHRENFIKISSVNYAEKTLLVNTTNYRGDYRISLLR